MIIKRVLSGIENPNLELISNTLDWEVGSFKLEQVGWDDYPYKPRVTLRLAYNENELFLKFKVKEQSVRAEEAEHNGNVWDDSCVEMFISPSGDDRYYNFEVSCIGKCLLGYRKHGDKGIRAAADALSKIRILPSLGIKTFPERIGETEWTLTAAIPFSLFAYHSFRPKSGDRITANFYKCGNKLSVPHYLSWQRIETPTPSFHQPQYFGELIFE